MCRCADPSWTNPAFCDCERVAAIRAAVAEEIAAAIDARYQSDKAEFGERPTTADQWYLDGLDVAEQIARSFMGGAQ
jgi:hypothetical protein